MEILCFIDQQQHSANEEFDPQQIEAKLSWLAQFREPLLEWQEYQINVKHFFYFFLDNTPLVRIVPVFFKVY
jgi:hypothetical protein